MNLLLCCWGWVEIMPAGAVAIGALSPGPALVGWGPVLCGVGDSAFFAAAAPQMEEQPLQPPSRHLAGAWFLLLVGRAASSRKA